MRGPAPGLGVLGLRLGETFGAARVASAVPLAPFTTFKVGGPADLFFEPRSGAEVAAAVQLAASRGVGVTMLGGGSNVLVSDAGIRGLVLRPRGGDIALEGDRRVRADAAVTINGLVRWLIARELAGLEAWAGTPGTVGGAIFGNAHWAGRLVSEILDGVRVVGPQGDVRDLPVDDMEFGYDRSRLQRTGEILISAVFRVSASSASVLREQARRSLAYRKRTQPLASPSAGCIFRNPGPGEILPPGLPRSAGALVDRAGMKGSREGGAVVSPTHANFIVNTGGATAGDIRALVARCQEAVRERFGVSLVEEIVYLGEFPPESGGTRVDAVD
jgi:UDP-N-acetylmuramate dehydrogenase